LGATIAAGVLAIGRVSLDAAGFTIAPPVCGVLTASPQATAGNREREKKAQRRALEAFVTAARRTTLNPPISMRRGKSLFSVASVEERGSNSRVLVAALWVACQFALILTAGRRADGAFGFRMFSESSTIKLALYRETDAGRVHVDGGVWTAHGGDGATHRLTWYERVRSPFWVFDQEMHASYGAAAQLVRLQAAIDDVTSHMNPSEDNETRRLVLDVSVRRNGHEAYVRELVSRERTF
jgi:hypothetical protein